jgi:GT2 family glycosyltransferase
MQESKTTVKSKSPKVEFLISTMYRTNLEFLETIFKNLNLNDLYILIVNQTSNEKQLTSDRPNIRVINSFETGLSKSRNLALDHAIGDICFISDDDVQYLPDAIDHVLEAYKEYPDAALISFQFLTKDENSEILYKKESGIQNGLLHKQHLHSIEITFKPKVLTAHNIRFNTCFGIGALFQSGEEEVLRDDLVRDGHQVVYVNKPIVRHLEDATVALEGSKEFTMAITAIKYRLHKNLIYLWLVRYIWMLLKRRSIRLTQSKQIWNYGIQAVRSYKSHCEA